jgi:hypothetical protein
VTALASRIGRTDWAPQKGDIVRLRPGFDRSFEGIAVRRAGLPLNEKRIYEVCGFERRESALVLTLHEVRRVHVGGVWRVTKLNSEPFPYAGEKFEPLR